MSKVWTICLQDHDRNYIATATYVVGMDAWNVVLVVDGNLQQAILTEDPCVIALQLIADAQLEADSLVVQE